MRDIVIIRVQQPIMRYNIYPATVYGGFGNLKKLKSDTIDDKYLSGALKTNKEKGNI